MKKRITKNICSYILIISILVTSGLNINVFAADSQIPSTEKIVGVFNYAPSLFSVNDTYYLGECGNNAIKYKIYRYYGDWYAIFNMDLSLPYYKGNSAMTVTQTMGKTYASETTYEFSASLGGTAGADIIELTSTITGSVSHTTGVSFEMTTSVSYEIERDDPTGYYKIGVCHDIYRHSVNVYYGSNYIDTVDMPIPRGIAYYALLYSQNSDSGFSKY